MCHLRSPRTAARLAREEALGGDDGWPRTRSPSRSRRTVARRTGTEERLVGLSWSTAFGTWEPTPSGEGLWGGREGVGAEQWRGKIDDVVERRQEGRRKDVSHPDLGTADLWGMR